MQTKSITLKEYCKLSGYSYQGNGIQKKLKQGTLSVGMVSAKKFGWSWSIDVLMTWYESKLKEVGNA